MKTFALFFLGSVILAPFTADAREGGGVSGGGDAYAAQFTRIGYDIYRRLKAEPLNGIDPEAFKTALLNVRVVSRKRLYLRGAEVDAINTPKTKRIQLSRVRWNALDSKPRERFVLVAHEYFSVMGLADDRYQISNQLFRNPGSPMLKYVCDPFPELTGNDAIVLEAYLYEQSYASITFYRKVTREPIEEMPAVYSLAIDEVDGAALPKRYSVVVTVSYGFIQQSIALPFVDFRGQVQTGKRLPMPAREFSSIIDASQTRQLQVFCDVHKAN